MRTETKSPGANAEAFFLRLVFRLSRFGEVVLVLAIAHDEDAFAIALSDDELEAEQSGVDGDERSGAVIVLPRAHLGLPLAKIEGDGVALLDDAQVAKSIAGVVAGELGG